LTPPKSPEKSFCSFHISGLFGGVKSCVVPAFLTVPWAAVIPRTTCANSCCGEAAWTRMSCRNTIWHSRFRIGNPRAKTGCLGRALRQKRLPPTCWSRALD